MKIVNINISANSGGAAKAAHRHNDAMRQCGIDAKMLVIKERSIFPSPDVISLCRFSMRNRRNWNKVRKEVKRIDKELRPYAAWYSNLDGLDLSDHKAIKEADAIWLHWVSKGMISIESLEKILQSGKPVYWFMHDMWAMTGGCHYSLGCERFTDRCGCCPRLNDNSGSSDPDDLSARQLAAKLKHWQGYPNLRILTPSNWLADCARRSSLLKGCDIKVFRNVIDTDIYSPQDKIKSRKSFGLPADKKLILFGAHTLKSRYKGWDTLRDALRQLSSSGYECVVFGKVRDKNMARDIAMPVHFVGKLTSDKRLASLYSACDVFVTASIADNYPNVLVEAMACGLPCVGFNIGGIPEIIDDGINGRIVDYGKSAGAADALAQGIVDVLTSGSYGEMCIAAREKIKAEASYEAAVRSSAYSFMKNQQNP